MFDTNETDYAYSATVFLRQNPIKKRKSSLTSVWKVCIKQNYLLSLNLLACVGVYVYMILTVSLSF